MKRYVITNTIQGRGPGSTPSDVTWYRGEDKGEAMAAMLQALNHGNDSDRAVIPNEFKYDVIAVKCDVFDVEDTVLYPEGYEVTWPEDHPYALSDCCWWDKPHQHGAQAWANVDCSGRMAEVSMTNFANINAIMCEAHVNAYPGS